MSFLAFKFIHVMGVVILVGNVTVTGAWKVFANLTRDPAIIAFAQRLVSVTDWIFTGGGIVLIVVGGYGMARTSGLDLSAHWLFWGQVGFYASGVIWLLVLLPLQMLLAREARAFRMAAPVPESYWRLERIWAVWGGLSMLPLLFTLYVMVTKPGWLA